eukprot:2251878-Prymnesium_polylepis.1
MIENPPVNPIIGHGRTANQVTARHIRATFRLPPLTAPFASQVAKELRAHQGELSRSGPIF